MEKIKVIQDGVGKTLTIWLGDPQQEFVCEETTDEVVLMKDKNGKELASRFCITLNREKIRPKFPLKQSSKRPVNRI